MGNWAEPNRILNKFIFVIFLFSRCDLPHLNIHVTMNSIKPIAARVFPCTSKIGLDMVGNKFYRVMSAVRYTES